MNLLFLLDAGLVALAADNASGNQMANTAAVTGTEESAELFPKVLSQIDCKKISFSSACPSWFLFRHSLISLSSGNFCQ